MRLVGWSRIGLLGVLVSGTLMAACSSPTQGPTIQIGADGWTASPETMVQTSDRFEITIVNTTDTAVNFILVRMDYGDVKDIPVVDGVVDATAQVVYESDDPTVQSAPVVAFIMIHPGEVGESLPPGWEPASVEAGEELRVVVGGAFGMGGGEPGAFAVISYKSGGIERGDFAVFNLTDENGDVPQMDLEDFFPTDDEP